MGVINGTVPYVLSYLGKEPVEDLGKVWVIGIVAVCLGYFVRGFKDSKEAADDELRNKRFEHYANIKERIEDIDVII